MKFEESRYFNILKNHKLLLPFGDFYFCEKFYIAEIHEGMHIDYHKLASLMIEIVSFYGKNKKLGVISNRINSYSTDPQSYNKIDEEFGIITVSAFVVYNDISFINASIEKRFSQKKIKRCLILDEAIEWMLNRKDVS